eukprot:GEMP01030328.1.p1 GENE.GEMP01030328.1~~GEMP01030328.1.p1  ORF type:complete len:311 (+),score=51.59 GEMP01030328.1:59-991(+)
MRPVAPRVHDCATQENNDDRWGSVSSNSSPPLPSLELSLLGFCGVDDSVCPRRLLDISLEYSFVEWGIIFREEKQGQPRYPSFEWLHALMEEVEKKQSPINPSGVKLLTAIRLAGHLCGNYCKKALEGDSTFIQKLHEEFGFLRIQLNPTKINGVNLSKDIMTYIPTLRSLCSKFPQVEFILQVNAETSRLAYPLMDDPLPNIAFLFDASMGTGKVPNVRPPPVLHPGVHCGYAGGLGPHNLHEELVKIAEAVCSYLPTRSRPVWVDMESSLRQTVNGRDVFDLNQTLECIQVIFDLGLKGEEDCGLTEA